MKKYFRKTVTALPTLSIITFFLLLAGGCHKTEVIQKDEGKNHILTFAGERVTIKPQSVAHGTHAVKPDNPERDCHDFQGWFADNDTFTKEWDFETDVVAQDTTLYAKWERNTLRGTKWKLEGIVDVQTGELKVLKPENCEICYVLIFNTDSTFNTYTYLGYDNFYMGVFEIDFVTYKFNIIKFGGPKGGEIGDARTYIMRFWNSDFQYFFYKEGELRLFYNDNKKYFLYKSW